MTTFEECMTTCFKALTANFNDGYYTLEKVFADVAELSQVRELAHSIHRTNNGYLFAPTIKEVDLAEKHSTFFIVRKGGAHPFPIRIENRYPVTK